ncbi:MAG: hypothetical protein JWL96_194 [Sphingomonas bacterium]|uniref:RcnB family protein n=1 Tax=Sphingomonas bacterium TaxID=1895847 RepID=UPI00262009AD|nr:RcnB family protein [Sphingomonas bacterium]MDB5708124.1 hypothetical protein [Sphingomonas bacterium]
MRTLMIAGLAMVTAIAVTPAESQRLSPAPMGGGQIVMGGGQVNGGGHWSGGGQVMGGGQWSGGGQAMPRPPMNGGMPHGPGTNYPAPQPQHPPMMPPANGGHWQNTGGGQWSGHSGGHWSGGTNAPGGWNAYHRPTRGWSLPRYWIAPSFYISDYGSYGLSVPPAGYGWSRYYDDAVLIDGRGRVADTAYGVDWDGNGYAEGGSAYASDGYAYAQGGAGGQGGVSYGQDYYQADDQADNRGYVEQAPAPPPARVIYRGGGQQGSYSSSYSSSAGSSGGGYVANGYYYPPVTTTTVMIESAPVVTTTTTEYVETYRAARRVYRPAPRHRVVRRSCTCACGCR